MDITTLAVAIAYANKVGENVKKEGFKVQVETDCSILETIGEEKVFYFLPKKVSKPKDGYDEYIYTNNNWEQIGSTDIDLSNYVTLSDLSTALEAKENTANKATAITERNKTSETLFPTIGAVNAFVLDKIAAITSLSFEVVQTKPTQNIKTNVIYLIPNGQSGTDNIYDEWIYVNNKWELIGSTAIDLSQYAKKSELPTKTSDLTNDSGFLTQHQDISGKEDKSNKSDDFSFDLTPTAAERSKYPTIARLKEFLTDTYYDADEVDELIPDTSGKVDKVEGKGLSTNDYTDAEKNKLGGIETGATKTVVDSALSASSTNPVQNKVIKEALDNLDPLPSGGTVGQVLTKTSNGSAWKNVQHQDISGKENLSNKSTSISSASTDMQYPSAKAVYDFVGATDAIPSYVKEEAESVLAKAFAHKGLGRTVRFIAVSDAHNDSTETSHSYTRIANKHCGQAVKYIAERIALDFVACLGDSTWAGVVHTTAQYNTKWLESDLQEMNSFLAEGFRGVPNIRVVGNHDQCATTDDNNVVSRLQNSGAYQLIGRYNAGVSDGLNNYGYYDITNVKLRIIYLNTSDTVSTSSQGTLLAVSQAQKNWLCETLIDVNTKSDAAQWRIMLLSHAPLDMTGSIDTDILIPYTNGGTYGNYVFTNHDAKIIGNCHGHTHCYNVGYMSDKIRRFTIPNANFYDNNHYKNNASYAAWNEDTTYPKTENSRTDTSFSLVTLDMDSLICYVDNYGAGYDREFSVDYKSDPVPVNLFDKDDPDVVLRARFNSSKQPVEFADEQLVTGFIPASIGTTFEFETDKANNTNGYTGFLMLYDANKQPIGGLSNGTTSFIWSSDYKNGSITVPQTYAKTDFTGTSYARFCLAYTDIDSIIITKG